MAIQDDNTLVSKGDLKALYGDKIAPYLGCNLMVKTGVRDFFSTEEKIVGVWIDGKPIYQITKKFTNPSVSWSGINFGFKVDAVWLVNIFANTSDGWSSGCSWYNTDANRGSFYVHKDSSGNVNLWIRNTYTVTEVWVTIQYTKPTDTANSAAQTPGCYDISRPDLWIKDTEIFFGNGLYGMRTAGTVTTPAGAQTDVIIVPDNGVTANGTLWSANGWYEAGGTGDYRYNINNNWIPGETYSCVWVDVRNKAIKCAFRNKATKTMKYDISVTYTK